MTRYFYNPHQDEIVAAEPLFFHDESTEIVQDYSDYSITLVAKSAKPAAYALYGNELNGALVGPHAIKQSLKQKSIVELK